MARKGSLGKRVSAIRLQQEHKSILTNDSEAWRYSGPFTRWNRLKGAFPGFGIAAVAFTGYVIFEAVFLKDSHGHAEGHGDKH